MGLLRGVVDFFMRGLKAWDPEREPGERPLVDPFVCEMDEDRSFCPQCQRDVKSWDLMPAPTDTGEKWCYHCVNRYNEPR